MALAIQIDVVYIMLEWSNICICFGFPHIWMFVNRATAFRDDGELTEENCLCSEPVSKIHGRLYSVLSFAYKSMGLLSKRLKELKERPVRFCPGKQKTGLVSMKLLSQGHMRDGLYKLKSVLF